MSEPERKLPNASSPQFPPFNSLTQQQFNDVFSRMLSSLRNNESDDEEDRSVIEDDSSIEEEDDDNKSSPQDSDNTALLSLLESHKLICEAVLLQLKKK